MIEIKSANQIEKMRKAGAIAASALAAAGRRVAQGVTTKELDDFIKEYIISRGATPTFLGYGGFPGSACISINEEVIHGIPKKSRILHEGDIVKIDVGAYYNGFHGDSANTFGVGKISNDAQALIDATRESFYRGVALAKHGNRVGDIGSSIFDYATSRGYGVVKKYVGHGVGHELHEDPEIPNFGTAGRGQRLFTGMTIAIEPMINAGTHEVRVLGDNWTVVTADGSLSAHYEHTVAITDGEPVLLTEVK